MSGWRAAVRARIGTFELDVELDVEGGALALIGPNGSGKTTFLRVLAGAVEAERAEIVVAGEVLASSRDGVHVPMDRRRVGYVPQGYGLFPHLSVLDNVAFGLSTGPHKLKGLRRERKARDILEDLNCATLADRRVAGLSGGEQQRVALARALVLEPELLLLDEPLAALDVAMRRAVRAFLAERLQAFGRPSVLVTHDARDVAALGARICALEDGRVVQTGSLRALREAPATDFVAEFVDASGAG